MKPRAIVVSALAVGLSCALSAPGADFDGDGVNDIGIFRPASGLWSIRGVTRVYFGSSGDRPLPGDYNGDGKVDICVFRPGSGLWSVRNVTRVYFGGSTDEPLPAQDGGCFWVCSTDNTWEKKIMFSMGNISLGVSRIPAAQSAWMELTADEWPQVLFKNSASGFGTNDGSAIALDGSHLILNNRESGSVQFYLNGVLYMYAYDGKLAIGKTYGYPPGYKLDVEDSQASSHVVEITNTNTSSNSDVLRLALGATTPGTSNNFITFYSSATGTPAAVGAIEGDGSGGITVNSGSADFAEWLPRLDPAEEMEAGDIVGVVAGMVTRRSSEAERAQVVSTAPAVLGNWPGEEREPAYEKVAFLGQVPVKVRGPVSSGDYIVPSGRDDGTGIAVRPRDFDFSVSGSVVGMALEDARDDGVKLVKTVVGLPAAERRLDELEKRLESLEKTLRELQTR